jgi:hypothetical protein
MFLSDREPMTNREQLIHELEEVPDEKSVNRV